MRHHPVMSNPLSPLTPIFTLLLISGLAPAASPPSNTIPVIAMNASLESSEPAVQCASYRGDHLQTPGGDFAYPVGLCKDLLILFDGLYSPHWKNNVGTSST
jgi:hypothetical protein